MSQFSVKGLLRKTDKHLFIEEIAAELNISVGTAQVNIGKIGSIIKREKVKVNGSNRVKYYIEKKDGVIND